MLHVDRDHVLAYRVAAHQFDRSSADPAVLDLGVQDTPYGSARLALAARTSRAVEDLTLVWTTRGAPHLHRSARLTALAAALWPLSDADATARIAVTHIKEGARLGIAAFTAAARAMHDVVRAPMAKGDVSTGVSARVPASLTYWCKPCQAQHISGGLFQQVGLAAGVRVEPAGGTTLAPIDGWPGVPVEAAGTDAFLATYLRLLGPATPAEAAKFLGTTVKEARRAWPADLTEVRVDGRPAWLPTDAVDGLRTADKPDLVRLLPPSDPYLQARDRDLLVPDRNRQGEVWRALAKPGALLVGTEIAGTWRAQLAGRNRLQVTVTAFEPLAPKTRTGVEDEAAVVATARGATDVRTSFA
jgi:hypothetical protein